MADRVLIEKMLEDVRRETEAKQLAEAEKRAAEVERQREAERQQQQAQWQQAFEQWQSLRTENLQTVAAMLEVFSQERVSLAILKPAHDRASEIFKRTFDLGYRLAQSAGDGRANRIAGMVDPKHALTRWAAGAPDDAVRRWRVGLIAAFYPGVFNISPNWPPSDFNPTQATDANVIAALNRGYI